VGVEGRPQGIPVDDRMSCGDDLWAIGDVTDSPTRLGRKAGL